MLADVVYAYPPTLPTLSASSVDKLTSPAW